MKSSSILIYLCITTSLTLYAMQAPKEKQATMKGLPQEMWLDEIICRNLNKEKIFKSIRDIWGMREISTFYRDLITPENIVKCIKKEKLEYRYGEQLLSRAIIVYSRDHKKYQLQVINILISGGFDPNLKNKQGSTALHQAAFSGETDIAKSLLDHGANINELNIYRVTPLMFTIHSSTLIFVDASDTIKLLISKGADLNLSPEKNKTVLEYARGRLNKLQGRMGEGDETHEQRLKLFEKHLKKYIQILEEAEKEQRQKSK